MSISRVKEEIDEIMEEMEAATPKFFDKLKTFNAFQDNVSDTVDANRYEGSNFFSSIFTKKLPDTEKPGQKYPSKPTNERYYDFTNSNVGFALIFNQVKIKGESERKGSEKDAKDLAQVLNEIGFTVRICTDFSSKEIYQNLYTLSQQDHSDNDCLLITIMTHGKRDGKIFSSDGEILVNDLWENFLGDKCETLIGKPKLFFIQACRGTSTDPGILLKPKPPIRAATLADTVDAKAVKEEFFVLPTLADLLVMYSTAEGFYSFRNPKDGSWFIQALCEELRENSHEELMTILTGVNRRVAFAKQSYVPHIHELDASKQMPIIQSMLTKGFYFVKRQQKLKLLLPKDPLI
ncbi:hypothetical protein ACKWTF_012217 [Chironomus riparius]